MPPLYSLPGKLKEHCVDLSLHPTPDHATLKPVREAEGVRSPVPSTRSKGLQRLHAEADQPASRPLGWQPPRPRGRAAFSNDHRMEAHSWVFQACAVSISGSLSQIQTLVPVVVRDTGPVVPILAWDTQTATYNTPLRALVHLLTSLVWIFFFFF